MQSEQSEYTLPWCTREYVDVVARARELGCGAPFGIALLPGNFTSAANGAGFRYHEIVPQVRRAWRSAGLADTGPGRKLLPRVASPSDDSDQDVPLVVFFGVDLPGYSARPILDALSMIASVLTASPRLAETREARLDAVVERPDHGGYACLEYKGNVYELVTLAKPIREIHGAGPNDCEQQARKPKSLSKEGGAGW